MTTPILTPVKIVYFGSGAFGLPTLRALARAHTIRAIVTQPDRPAGRGGRLTPTPVGEWAASEAPGLPLFKPEKVNLPEIRDAVRAHDADAWVVIAFGQKLSAALLADRFAVNLHASLLPRWRGAAPINAAMVAGDAEIGNSVITLADRMDAGLILGQSSRPVEPTQTMGELHDLLAEDGAPLVLEVLARHAAGTLSPHPQDESQVTLAPRLSKADGRVDFADQAARCRARINGLSPWPGVTVGFRGEPLKVLRADSQSDEREAPPGVLLDAAQGLVRCAPGTALRVLEVQPPGKRVMPWADFARGRKVENGEALHASPDTK